MTSWSQWLTDPSFYASPLPVGALYWTGSTSTGPLDAAPLTYAPAAGNGTTDVFFGYVSSYRGSDSGFAAIAYTIGVDASWLTNPAAAFPDIQNPAALAPNLLARWAGGWEWAGPNGTLTPDSHLSVSAGAHPDDLGNPQTAHPDILVWLDDEVTWTAGTTPHMQRPAWDQAARLAHWSSSPVRERFPGAPTAVSLDIPISEVAARGYRVAVTFAVDLDVPPVPGPAGADYKLQHQGGLAATAYVNPQFRITLTIPPPQRQFPRDDGLGASSRRSCPVPTSKQYGQRRGPTATYQ